MTSTGRSSRAVGRPGAARSEPAQDPLAAAVAVWTSVVSGLESARYAEVGTEYAKLSALLVQQRTARVLAGAPVGADWDELARLAQRALDLLEPLLGAARLLATMPAAATVSPPAPRRRSRPAAAVPDAPPSPKPPRKAAAARNRQPGAARSTTTPPAPRAATKRS